MTTWLERVPAQTARVLVAGVGNRFARDDGFGPEVVRRLEATGTLPPGVRAVDYGTGGLDLTYDLLGGYEVLVLVDAAPVGERPGEVVVLELGESHLGEGLAGHGMAPAPVLTCLRGLGARLPRTYLIGCRPADTGEGIGLSAVVEGAVPEAMILLSALLRHPSMGVLRSKPEAS